MTRRILAAVLAMGLLAGACKTNKGALPPVDTSPLPTRAVTTTTIPFSAVAPGTYQYERSSTNHVKGTYRNGPVDRTRQSSGSPRVTFMPLSENRQYVFSRGDIVNHSQVISYETGSAQLAAWRSKFKNSITAYKPDPPVTLYPLPLLVGAKWNWSMTSATGNLTRAGSFEAVRVEDVTVGGVVIPCVVVEGALTLTGAGTATIHTTTWYAPSLSLAVQEIQTTDYRVVRPTTDLAVHLVETTKLLNTLPNQTTA